MQKLRQNYADPSVTLILLLNVYESIFNVFQKIFVSQRIKLNAQNHGKNQVK